MTRLYNVTFTVDFDGTLKTFRFKSVTARIFYYLRERYRAKYGNDLYEIEVVTADAPHKRVEVWCWFSDDGGDEYNDPVAFYARYGW